MKISPLYTAIYVLMAFRLKNEKKAVSTSSENDLPQMVTTGTDPLQSH